MNRCNIVVALVAALVGLALGECRFSFENRSLAQQPEHRVSVDDSSVVPSYANFCRVTGTPEEVILDYGVNAHPFAAQPDPIKINQRTILSPYAAKRMLRALEVTVERYEKTFGEIETDVQKRAKAAPAGETPLK